jgi:hypothetical protein
MELSLTRAPLRDRSIAEPNDGLPPKAAASLRCLEGRLWGRKSGSRDQGRATAVGSKKRPSPWRAPTGEMRRKQTLA